MIGEDRQRTLLRQLAGEDGGNSLLGVRVHRRRASEPDGVPASEAKFGKRTASTCCARFISETVGNSSNTTTTTPVCASHGDGFASAFSGKTSFDTGESKRNSARKMMALRPGRSETSASPSHAGKGRGCGAEQSRVDERGGPTSVSLFVSACRTITPTSPPTKARWSTHAAAGLTSPTRSSIAMSASGGNSVSQARTGRFAARRAAHRKESRVLAQDVEERLRKRQCTERDEVSAAARDRDKPAFFTTPIPCRHQAVTYFSTGRPNQSGKRRATNHEPRLHRRRQRQHGPSDHPWWRRRGRGSFEDVVATLPRAPAHPQARGRHAGRADSVASESESLDPVREPVGKP